MYRIAKHRSIALLCTLLLAMSIVACGTNFPATSSSATPSPTKFSNIPQGKGMDPEPGTDGKAAPLPNGHNESIVISNGVAYTGSDNGSLYALGLNDGKVRWQSKIGPAVAVFAVVGNTVYASGDSVLYALNVGNGALLWRYQSGKYISQVLVVGSMVYVNTAADNNSSTLSVVQASNGKLLWRNTLATFTPSLMGVVDGTVYLSQDQGDASFATATINALRANDGHIIWHLSLQKNEGMANGGVVVVNGIVYFATSQGVVYALQASTGSLLWHTAQHTTMGDLPNAATPVVANGMVYSADRLGLSAYAASDGKLMWQYRNAFPGPFTLSPTVSNGVVYFSRPQSGIVALRASDGKLLWQHNAGGFNRPLALINGMVINYSGPVYALRATDGTLLWQRNVMGSGEGSDAGSPEVIGEGVVLNGGDDGSVQAIRVSDGSLLWHYAIQELAVQSPPVLGAYIFFAPSQSYSQALQIVTNLGLKTFADCQFDAWATSDNKILFTNAHEMTVLATVNSAPLWLDRLKATAGVQGVQPGGVHSCTLMRPASNLKYLPAAQVGIYIQVTFATTAQYAATLNAVNGLGFRLAAPCYEQSRAQGHKPTWHAMDQSSPLNQSHALVLATTFSNATTWQSQLRAVQGVVKVEVPFKMEC